MKRMLFNATQQEELRVAIVDGQKLIDIDIESNARELHKSNIYKAVITRIEPSLEACFVNYGEDRHGFLPFKEVSRSLFREGVDVRNATIKDALSEGQEIMVQVEKEERGNKGAALTTFISLAGRYLVLMPNNPRGGGVSRRVEGEERQELRETMDKLDVPPGMSIIARTAGIGRTVEELQWDLNYLLQLWNAIESAGSSAPGAFLIYHESSLVIRAIRDYFQPDIGEILIDTDEIYEQAHQFMSYVMPDMANRVKRYRDGVPLFSRFQIEHQIESAYSRVVSLPSGGSIVIDHTEALVAIDVNSARSTRGTDIETTAFTTNCEAAEEVARQLRLRDLGGLIVIDFIDMESPKNRREIEARLKEALHYDRARVQMDKISRFGLMELSRQRLRPSLSEGSHIACPRCNGTGHIRDTESSALQVLRIIEEESMKESSAVIHVQIPVDVAAFLLNEKRGEIMKVESRHKVKIVLIPNKYLETPHYKLERIKHDDPRLEEPEVSYKLAEQADVDMSFSKRQKEPVKPPQEAKVKNIPEGMPAPVVDHNAPAQAAVVEKGFFDRLLGFLGIGKSEAPKEEEPAEKQQARGSRRSRNQERSRGRGRRGEARDDKTRTAQPATDATPEQEDNTQVAQKPARQRRARGEKAERQREERKPLKNEEESAKQETSVPATTAVAKPVMTALVPVSEAVQVVSPETDASAETASQERPAGAEEETRRRRRRGGRGRNRRDSQTDMHAEQGETATDVATDAATGTDVAVAAPETAQEVAAGDAQAEKAVPVQEGHADDNAVSHRREGRRSHSRRRREVMADTAADAEVVSAVAKEPNVAPDNDTVQDVHTVQIHAEVEPVQVTAVTETEVVAVEAQPVVIETEAVVVESVTVETDTVPEQAQTVETEAASVAETPVVTETVVRETVAEVPVAGAAEVADMQEVPAVPVAEAVATTEDTSPAPAADDPVSALEKMLAEAGLTMAVTDPDKMKQVQENQPQAEAVKRPVRRRKPPVVVDEGPLIQVDTRKPS